MSPMIIEVNSGGIEVRNSKIQEVTSDEDVEKAEEALEKAKSAPKNMIIEGGSLSFQKLTVPFTFPQQMKGIYICVDHQYGPVSLRLSLWFEGKKKCKYAIKFPGRPSTPFSWYFIPISSERQFDKCILKSKGGVWGDRDSECAVLHSLVFIREPTVMEEFDMRKKKEKTDHHVSSTKGDLIYRQSKDTVTSKLLLKEELGFVMPNFDCIMCVDDTRSPDAHRSGSILRRAKEMLRGTNNLDFSKLSIPFVSPSRLYCAYLIVGGQYAPPSLLFSFTHQNGTKTRINFTFECNKWKRQVIFLKIDLENVVQCDLDSCGMWYEKNSKYSEVEGLLFHTKDYTTEILDIIAGKPAETLPYISPVGFSIIPPPKEDIIGEDEEEKGEEEEEKGEEEEENSVTKSDEDEEEEEEVEDDDEEEEEEESIREFTEEEDGEDKTSWLDKIWEICSQSSSNTFTITADDVTHLCMIGKGGFGEAILVRHVEDKRGGEFVLKRMENDGSAPTVGDAYKKEFQKQMKLYNNPNCFHRIPQPICLFDDLDDDNCGIYGFCMEFCQGGSISEFSEKWCRCAGGSEDSISDCDTDYIRSRVNPMDLDPLR
ncbi:hypothetical protein ADUPG1_008532, partial [Aduncisulcus paluster]